MANMANGYGNGGDPRHFVTGRSRLSYCHLFEPRAGVSGGEAKYSVTVLMPKTDQAAKARLDAAVEAAKQAGKDKCWGGRVPQAAAIPVYDGDGLRPSDGEPFGDECKGHWVFRASSKQQPEVVDAARNPILDPAEVYSGCYGRVSCDFFPYEVNGKKGVGCALCNAQKLADGAPLSRKATVEEDFGQDWQEHAEPPQQYQPPYAPPHEAPQPYQPALQYQQPYQPAQPYAPPHEAQQPYAPAHALPYESMPGMPQYAPPHAPPYESMPHAPRRAQQQQQQQQPAPAYPRYGTVPAGPYAGPDPITGLPVA